MNAKLLQAICQEIYRRYPQMVGKRPRVHPVSVPAGKTAGQPAHLLVFESQGQTAGQRKITTLLRVVVDRDGKILKISTSR
jgi:hypothetical protein